MSIATIESQKITKSDMKRYYRVDDNTINPTYALAMCRYAYIAGRTARPTAVEVEEAAYALWKTEVNMASLNPTESEYTGAWGKLSIQQRDMYISKAAMMLEEARKAVSE